VCVLSTQTGVVGTLQIFFSGNVAPPPLPSPPEYDVIRDDGQVLRYLIENGTVVTPSGISFRFTQTSSGFLLTDDQDDVETYSADGALQTITSRAGVSQTMSYDASGKLSAVTDSFGNSLALSRDSAGRLSSVTFNSTGTVQYAYDGSSRLHTVTNLDGTT